MRHRQTCAFNYLAIMAQLFPRPFPSREIGAGSVYRKWPVSSEASKVRLRQSPLTSPSETPAFSPGGWSPQHIAGWLAVTYADQPELRVSHETIYPIAVVVTTVPKQYAGPAGRSSGPNPDLAGLLATDIEVTVKD